MTRTVGAVFGHLFYLLSLQNSPTHPCRYLPPTYLPLAEEDHMINHPPDKTTYPSFKKSPKFSPRNGPKNSPKNSPKV